MILALSGVAALGYSVWVYSNSPDRVPVHYDLAGQPDRWGSAVELLVLHGVIIGVGTALFLALPELVRRAPKALLNLPNKHYWLSPAHREEATSRFAVWAGAVGTALNLLIVALQGVLRPFSNHNSGGGGANVPALIGAFGLFTLGACVWLGFAYRLPKTKP